MIYSEAKHMAAAVLHAQLHNTAGRYVAGLADARTGLFGCADTNSARAWLAAGKAADTQALVFSSCATVCCTTGLVTTLQSSQIRHTRPC